MSTTVPEARSERWLTLAVVAVILLGCANLLPGVMVDPDLWGHIQYGEDWIAEGALPRTASHTFGIPDYPWINHENLSELALALGHRAVGGLGLVVARCLLGLLVFISMLCLATRRGVQPLVAAACLVPVAAGLTEFWSARPQLSSFLCAAVMLLVLESGFRDWHPARRVRFDRLLWLLPIVVVWTNSHGGFVAGVCILGAYLGIRCVEASWTQGRAAVPVVGRLSGLGVLCLLATLLNPYGPELMLWLIRSLGVPRPEIVDWRSILDSGYTLFPYTLMTGLAITLAVMTRRHRDPAHFVILGLVAVQAFLHLRHVAFLAILFGYWMPPHVQSVWSRFQRARESAPREPMTRRALLLLGAEFAMVLVALGGLFGWQLSRFGVERDNYPVTALQYMEDNGLHGRVVVTFNWAQYTLAALSPDSTVSFDGRFRTCYPQEVVDMNFDLTLGDRPDRYRGPDSGPFNPLRVLEFQNPDLVLLERHADVPGVEVMESRPEWVCLYRDGLAQLWGRASRYDDPQSPFYLAPERRHIGDEEQTGLARWPAFPDRSGRLAFVVRDTATSRLARVRPAAGR